MIHISDLMLQKGPHTRSGIDLPLIRGLVVHWVGNAGTSAPQNAAFFDSIRDTGPRYASYHYLVDVDGCIYQLIPQTEVAWHAGPSGKTFEQTRGLLGGLPNWRTLGISYCHKDWTGDIDGKAYGALLALCSKLCHMHKIPVERVLRHFDCTGKICPRWFVDHPSEWTDFKRRLEAAIYV